MANEVVTRVNLDRWLERIYSESDIGRGIATSLSGLIALGVYLYTRDRVIGAFALIVVFPIARIVSLMLHSRYIRSRQSSKSRKEIKEQFENSPVKNEALYEPSLSMEIQQLLGTTSTDERISRLLGLNR